MFELRTRNFRKHDHCTYCVVLTALVLLLASSLLAAKHFPLLYLGVLVCRMGMMMMAATT